MNWDRNSFTCHASSTVEIQETLEQNGLMKDEHFRIYTVTYNSVLHGTPIQHIDRKLFVFLGAGENALMAKLVL